MRQKLGITLFPIIFILILGGCGFVDEAMDKVGSLIENETKDADSEKGDPVVDVEPNSPEPTVETVNTPESATNNPHQLSEDLLVFLNMIHIMVTSEPEQVPQEELEAELPNQFDLTSENISESELNMLIDKLYATVGEVPDDFPLTVLPHVTFVNLKFIPVGYNGLGSEVNQWEGTFIMNQEVNEIFQHYRDTLINDGLELTSEGNDLAEETSLAEAYLSFEGNISGDLFEVHIMINDFLESPLEGHNRVTISAKQLNLN